MTNRLMMSIKMITFSLILGVLCGLMAFAFHTLIAVCHHLFFFLQFHWHYDVNLPTPQSSLGYFFIVVPPLVGVLVVYIIQRFAPEAKGHGVPEVIDAVHYKEGAMRPVAIWAKAVASALTIGSGGSAGREGPIVQICAGIGSWLQRHVPQESSYEKGILLASGAAAGIAATFNAPLGGLFFAVELLLVEITAAHLLLVILATVVSTYVGQMFAGIHPAFHLPTLMMPPLEIQDASVLFLFSLLGVLIAVCSASFIHVLYGIEDWFDARFANPYMRHIVGMSIIAILLILSWKIFGYYYIDGIGGYAVMHILKGQLTSASLLFLLFILKMLATCITIGSGGSGGVFSPSLYLGAVMGGAFGAMLTWIMPTWHISIPVFAIAGMAAMISATTGALLMGSIIVLEMTGSYSSVLPILIASGMSTFTRSCLIAESVYTMKLRRRHVLHRQGLQNMNKRGP